MSILFTCLTTMSSSSTMRIIADLARPGAAADVSAMMNSREFQAAPALYRPSLDAAPVAEILIARFCGRCRSAERATRRSEPRGLPQRRRQHRPEQTQGDRQGPGRIVDGE